MDLNRSSKFSRPLQDLDVQNPAFIKTPGRDIYMAVDFISAKIPAYKAIQTRLKKNKKPPTPNKVNMNQVHKRKLGPGAYPLNTPERSLTSRFSSLPRFSHSTKLKLIVRNLEKPSPQSLSRGRELYKKNLDTAPHSTSNKMIKIKQLSESRDNFSNLARKTRENIWKLEKTKRLEKLTDRDQKYERWNAARFCIQAQKGWVVLMACITAADILDKIRNKKKQMKKIFAINSKLLYQVSKAIGKFKLLLKEIRRKKSLKILEIILLPMMHQKVSNIFNIQRKLLVNCLEKCLTKRLFKRLFLSWSKKYKKVFSGLNSIVMVYKSRMERLDLYWQKIQTAYHAYSDKIIIPHEDSEQILRKYLFNKMKNFYSSKKNYAITLEKIQNEFKNTVHTNTNLFEHRKALKLKLEIGIPPVFRIYNKEEIIRLYLEEEQKRHPVPDKKDSLLAISASELRKIQTFVRHSRTYRK